ncbi:MAG: hypothetical protein FWG65_03675 [Turicibacter sp.]|nr:hypothetical protein [Turicibacter sp.]
MLVFSIISIVFAFISTLILRYVKITAEKAAKIAKKAGILAAVAILAVHLLIFLPNEVSFMHFVLYSDTQAAWTVVLYWFVLVGLLVGAVWGVLLVVALQTDFGERSKAKSIIGGVIIYVLAQLVVGVGMFLSLILGIFAIVSVWKKGLIDGEEKRKILYFTALNYAIFTIISAVIFVVGWVVGFF